MTNKSQILIAALQDAGYKPRSYSGRGMYGKECVAVSSDSLFAIGAVIVGINVPEPESDQLGKRYIFYWPSYPWPEAGIKERIDTKVETAVDALASAVDRAEAKTGHKLTITEAPTPQIVDITPRGCQTVEGTRRVAKAQEEWDSATHELANVVKGIMDGYVYGEGLNGEDVHQLKLLIRARDVKQEAFLLAVSGR